MYTIHILPIFLQFLGALTVTIFFIWLDWWFWLQFYDLDRRRKAEAVLALFCAMGWSVLACLSLVPTIYLAARLCGWEGLK